MSYGSGQFSASPVDFSRFLQMTRSSSRSLSPERELKQMLSHAHRPQPRTSKSTAHARGTSARPVAETAASAAATSFSRQAPLLDHSDSRSTSGDAAASAPATLASSSHHLSDRTHPFVSDVDADAERSHSNSVVVSAALQWQYGSPLYYPVTKAFYCWNGHTLCAKRRGEYGDLEGVSCDFCGFTHWLEETPDTTADVRTATKSTSRSSRSRKTRKATAVKEEAKTTESASPTPSETIFYHCDSCGVDLCVQCLQEVREDERYHVPCMKCLKCHEYVASQNAAAHRCVTATATAPVTPSQATLVMASLKPEERASILKVDRTPTTVKVEAEVDLLSAALPVVTKLSRTDSPVSAQRRSTSLQPQTVTKGRSGRPRASDRASPRRKAAKLETDVADTLASTESAAPPPPPPPRKGLWAVRVTTRTPAEKAEAVRLAAEQGLPIAEEGPKKRELVFYLPTRLAAEKCAGRARESGLEAVVQKNV